MTEIWDYNCTKCGSDDVDLIEPNFDGHGEVTVWKCNKCGHKMKAGIYHILKEE